jgi:hypothetical protein
MINDKYISLDNLTKYTDVFLQKLPNIIEGDKSSGLTTNNDQCAVNLKSFTKSTLSSASASSIANHQYPINLDKDGYLSVNVPWTDTNTYIPADGTTISDSTGSLKVVASGLVDNSSMTVDSKGKLEVKLDNITIGTGADGLKVMADGVTIGTSGTNGALKVINNGLVDGVTIGTSGTNGTLKVNTSGLVDASTITCNSSGKIQIPTTTTDKINTAELRDLNNIPVYAGEVASATINQNSTNNTSATIWYIKSSKSFAAKVGSTYYANWIVSTLPAVKVYNKNVGGEAIPNKLYYCNNISSVGLKYYDGSTFSNVSKPVDLSPVEEALATKQDVILVEKSSSNANFTTGSYIDGNVKLFNNKLTKLDLGTFVTGTVTVSSIESGAADVVNSYGIQFSAAGAFGMEWPSSKNIYWAHGMRPNLIETGIYEVMLTTTDNTNYTGSWTCYQMN